MSADRLLEDALRYIADTPLHSRELDWLEDQIQQALAALRGPEPNWSEAPDEPSPGAQFWTADANGCARWWRRRPFPTGTGTWGTDGVGGWWNAGRVDLPLGTDWRLTLRQRPRGEQA